MAVDPIDPLLVMLQRHEAANAAYDKLEADGVDADQAFEKCSETARAIVDGPRRQLLRLARLPRSKWSWRKEIGTRLANMPIRTSFGT